MNRYVISDIHGCNLTFKKMLEKIALNKDDELYILGDFVDRGPDSKGVLDTVLQLISDGYNVQSVRGNHDEWFITAGNYERAGWYRGIFDDWIANGGRQTIKSYPGSENIQLCDYMQIVPKEHIDFLTNLPCHIELDDVVLVHAGLRFEPDRMLQLMYAALENYEITDPIAQTSDSEKMWIRAQQYDYNLLNGKKLIVGHTAVFPSQTQKMVDEGKDLIIIDNGCVFADDALPGKLCCLEINNMELRWQEKVD